MGDLSHQINANHTLPSLPALQQEDLYIKDGFHVQKFTVVEGQYGTRAPIHFNEGGRWLDEIARRSPLATLCYRQV